MPFYAVSKGRQLGVFDSWPQCERHVKGFSGAKFKKFRTRQEALLYMGNATQAEPEAVQSPGPIQNNACLPTEQQLALKYGVVLNTTPKQSIKKTAKISNSKNTKKGSIQSDVISICSSSNSDSCDSADGNNDENLSTFIDDEEGDQELLLALSALQEFPDHNSTRKGMKNQTQKRKANQIQGRRIKRQKNNLDSFTLDKDGYANVYIAGYCENIGSWAGIAGFGVFFGYNHPFNASKAATGRMTHNVGDIEAAVYALKVAQRNSIQKICVNTASDFLLKAVSSWMHFWQIQGWRNKSGKVVQNRKELEELNKLLKADSLDVKWNDANNCSDIRNEMNEAAKLARDGSDEYLSLHPKKDMDNSFDFEHDFDHSFF